VADFFGEKRAAAVLKHAVLDSYVDPFAMKVGSTATDRRVAFIDGFAGEGRYEDGGEGSPALLLRKAKALAGKRQIDCYLVEKDSERLATLRSVIEAEGDGVTVEVFAGDVAEHVETLLDRTGGTPLFMFLDPFGLMISFGAVEKVLTSRPNTVGAATEILINFSTIGLRRIAGMLTSPNPTAATLARMDAVCGGDWWRAEWLKHAPTKDATEEQKIAAEESVVAGYAARLGRVGKTGWWTVDVHERAHYRAKYHLVFLSRHPDGLHLFGEALSSAQEKWRRTIWDVETRGTLFGGEDNYRHSEEVLANGWIDEIERNLRAALQDHGRFRVAGHYAEIYGKALGLARQKHLRTAWKRLHADGTISTDSKGDLIEKWMEPR
jgi:three-Cys-motif partner protein